MKVTRRAAYGALAGCFALFVDMQALGVFVLVLHTMFELAFGWLSYSVRVVPASVDLRGIAWFCGWLIALAVAQHMLVTRVTARMSPPRRWRPRDTAAALALLVTLFVAGMSIAGIGHQIGWLAKAEQPLTRSSWDTIQVAGTNICLNLKAQRSTRGTFPLREILVGHQIFHIVPVDLNDDEANAVLIFPRDGEQLARDGGLLCAATKEAQRLAAADVKAPLGHLTPPPH